MGDPNDEIRRARQRVHGEMVASGAHVCFDGCELAPTRAVREGGTQPLPTSDNLDLPSMHDLVTEEIGDFMADRKALGIERYGQPLRPFNGRDAGVDAWEEWADLGVYLRQAMYETEVMREVIAEFLRMHEISDEPNEFFIEEARRAIRINKR